MKRQTIRDMRRLAAERNGTCLSTNYIDSKTKLKWMCSEGHVWKAISHNIKHGGQWCRICALENSKRLNREKKFKEFSAIATQKKGKCLSTEYIDNKTKLKWMCSEGHIWKAAPKYVKNVGAWCRICSASNAKSKAPISIEDMHNLAAQQKGKCLSTAYINNRTKLLWKCSDGHAWEATPEIVKKGRWCRICEGNLPITINELQKIATERGGKCLSTDYVNGKTKLECMCSEGHVWKAILNHIKYRGSWCPECAGKSRRTIRDMQQFARERNGKCLSDNYVNADSKLEWMCSEGHTWKAVPNSIQQGSWCPRCAGILLLTIEEMHRLAAKRNGKCLSTEYVSSQSRLEWMCSEGHAWEAVPASIKRGSWCPECNFFLSEQLCRTAFEELFELEFPKRRPVWLLNAEGNRMELDGYCEGINVAFEYNGEQHYQVGRYTKDDERLQKRIDDDELKQHLCKKNGVYLFVFDYEDDLTKLPSLIRDKSKNLEFVCNSINFRKKIDYSAVYHGKIRIEILNDLAQKNGGRCLSSEYLGNSKILEWMCSEGHTWKAVPNSIQQGTWCPKCAGNFLSTIEEMHQLASKRNGKCLSSEYVNSQTKLKWLCSEGHTWEAIPASIKRGKWCRACSSFRSGRARRSTIEEMQKIAVERNGKCLSTDYVNGKTKLEWMCSEGHIWKAAPHHIKLSRSWCPKCSAINAWKNRR